jgi:hypothetical protein
MQQLTRPSIEGMKLFQKEDWIRKALYLSSLSLLVFLAASSYYHLFYESYGISTALDCIAIAPDGIEATVTPELVAMAQTCNSTGTQILHALLISGQCYRFIYREQSGPLFEWHPPPSYPLLCAPPTIDVYIALHCGTRAKPFRGELDAPPYINETNLNVSDIQYWFQSVRGANTVTVQLFDDVAMDAIDQEMLSFAVSVRGYAEGELSQFVNRFWEPRMKANLRMFFLRHAAFQMSITDRRGQSYNAYTYWREDNYFFHPLNISVDSFGNDTTQPYVVVDEPCEFGSYSDKMYVMNREGANLLFDSTRSSFLKKMKHWVLFSKLLDKKRYPFQTERFLHDLLTTAVVEKRVLNRIDVRYVNGSLCTHWLYFKCMPEYIKQEALRLFVVCEKRN